MNTLTRTRTLRVVSTNGLCNRLLALLSGRAIAEASGRSFGMDWVTANTCNCPFNLLFENDWNVQAIDVLVPTEWLDLRETPLEAFPDLLQAPEQHLRVRHHVWLINPAKYPSHVALLARVIELFQELVPCAPLLAQVDAFQANRFRPTMIGIHLRRGDYVVGRPDHVNNLIETEIAVDRWLEQAPDAGIFLCTDDGAPMPFSSGPSLYQGVREHFQKRYGDRVILPPTTRLDRASPEAIQDALIELWLLRRTHYFVGTTDSTFSETAALGHNIPIVMTSGQTEAYQKRVQGFKRTGLYHLLMAAGRLEFGTETSYYFLSSLYKTRLGRLKEALRFERDRKK